MFGCMASVHMLQFKMGHSKYWYCTYVICIMKILQNEVSTCALHENSFVGPEFRRDDYSTEG